MKTAVIIRTGNQTGNRYFRFFSYSFSSSFANVVRSYLLGFRFFEVLDRKVFISLRHFTERIAVLHTKVSFLCDCSQEDRFSVLAVLHRKGDFRSFGGFSSILILFTALLALFGNALVHWPAVTALQLFTQRTDQMKLMCIEGPLAINFP
ncbi:unnamed protein product [Rhizophagus irregularis]|nr:unnamed protein product [Rhizophagus irregularis]